MSVAIVAEYPWNAIRDLAPPDPRAVIVCCDTRVVGAGQKPLPHLAAKFRRVGRGIFVTYTSSHLFATTKALDEVTSRADARQIGDKLKKYHQKFGGVTELLAVAWGARAELQPLEVMPPHYLPRPVSGIVGIGDRDVLSHFRSNFVERPPDRIPVTPEMAKGLSKALGRELKPWSAFPLRDACAAIVAAFSNAAAETGGPTVGLPIQNWIVTANGATRLEEVVITKDNQMEQRSLAGRIPIVFSNSPSRIAQDWSPRAAVRLFD